MSVLRTEAGTGVKGVRIFVGDWKLAHEWRYFRMSWIDEVKVFYFLSVAVLSFTTLSLNFMVPT